jgi:hypothetical protein
MSKVSHGHRDRIRAYHVVDGRLEGLEEVTMAPPHARANRGEPFALASLAIEQI